jgi:hypothetical protein
MIGAIPPLPQYAFMAWCSVKKSTLPFTLPEDTRTFGRPGYRWEGNIKVDFKDQSLRIWTGFM